MAGFDWLLAARLLRNRLAGLAIVRAASMAVTTAAAAIAMIPTVAISACRPLVMPMDGMANLTRGGGVFLRFLSKQEHKVSYQYSQKRYPLLHSVQGFKRIAENS